VTHLLPADGVLERLLFGLVVWLWRRRIARVRARDVGEGRTRGVARKTATNVRPLRPGFLATGTERQLLSGVPCRGPAVVRRFHQRGPYAPRNGDSADTGPAPRNAG
jgi:hypothetical protein